MALYHSLVCLLGFYITAIDGRYFRNDYTFYEAIDGWLKFHLMPETWEEARIQCFFEGAVLASPLDNELLTTMKAKVGKSRTVFTGMSSNFSNGNFFSIEGVSLDKIPTTWSANEPNNCGEENCIAMDDKGNLSDVNCQKPLPYLCYRRNSQDIPSVTQCGTVDPDYVFEKNTGHCYKFHRFGQTWSRAFMACTAEGGYLAIINTDAEAQILVKLMSQNPSALILATYKEFIGIGYRDWSEHGIFMTIHGQTLKEAGYEKWSGGQPDNSGGEYCGSVLRNGLLNDVSCHGTVPFICEKEPGSLLDNETGQAEEIGFLQQRAATQ